MHRLPLAAAGLTLVLFLACGDEPATTEPDVSDTPDASDVPGAPAALELSADSLSLTAIGAADRLSATVSDTNGIAIVDVSVTWTSADDSVATVDDAGRVEATGAGETEIVASAGGVSDTAAVVVTQAAASVSISPVLSELHAIGDSVRLEAVVRDAGGSVIPGAAVDWTSADTAVATVDADGWVAAQGSGTATISAAAGDASAEAGLVVRQVAASVAVTPAVDTVGMAQTAQLDAMVADSNGVAIPDAAIVWTSGDPAVATVDAAGRAQVVGWGTDVSITATAGGASGSASIHVAEQFAFYSPRTGDDEIYLMNEDGTGVIQLTHNSANDRSPQWSPDGSEIAFHSDRNGNVDIYVMKADGSDQKRITFDGADDTNPTWSPDGSRIAFESDRAGNDEIYWVNADGLGGEYNLTNATGIDAVPAWSPDGTQIVFTSGRDANYEIYIMNADGSSQTNLTMDGDFDFGAAWSPDGTRIAFRTTRDGDDEIYVMDADGSSPTNLTNVPGVVDACPAWSPDGARIAFTSRRTDDNNKRQVYIMNADGTGQAKVANQPSAYDNHCPVWRPRP